MPNSEGAIPAAGVVLLHAEDNLGATVLNSLRAAADISRVRAFDKWRFVDSPLVVHEELAAANRHDPQGAIAFEPPSCFRERLVLFQENSGVAVATEPPMAVCERRRLDAHQRSETLEAM